MGLLIYPVFDPPVDIPDDKTGETTGEFLGRHFDVVDEGAVRLGLAPITSFADQREVPEDFDGDPDELDELLGPSTEWFDAAEGSRAMTALAEAIVARPEEFDLKDESAAVVDELHDLARTLAVAAEQKARFRLELS